MYTNNEEFLKKSMQVFAEIDGILLRTADTYNISTEYAGAELLKEMRDRKILTPSFHKTLIEFRRSRNEVIFNGYIPNAEELRQYEEVLTELRKWQEERQVHHEQL